MNIKYLAEQELTERRVGENCDNLRRLWPALSAEAKAVIIRDIKEELARPNGGGAEMDRKSWRSVLQQLEE
jgi:hypothetical protein